MRISDLSSDVCSSDLAVTALDCFASIAMTLFIRSLHFGGLLADQVAVDADAVDDEQREILPADAFPVGLEKPPGDQRDAAGEEDHELTAERKSTRMNSSLQCVPRIPSSA